MTGGVPTTASSRRPAVWPADVPAPARADDEPLVLPEAAAPPRRTQLPILASVVPVLAAVGLWLVTGSVFALWFALLGPLIAAATLLDGRRAARRDRRRAHADAAAARDRIAVEIEGRHARERQRRWQTHPDVAMLAADDAAVWRASTGSIHLVIGRGDGDSAVRVSGGGGDPDAATLRARASRLGDAPVTAALTGGIAITGPPVIAAAVARALAMQVCLRLPPEDLRVIGPASGEWGWSARLPQRRSSSGLSLALVGPGDVVPAADAVIARVEPGVLPPPRCDTILTVTGIERGRWATAGESGRVEVEALSVGQAADLAEQLAERARSIFPEPVAAPPVHLADLLDDAPPATPAALRAVLGVDDVAAVEVDLVADGPHAVVAGVTGSGKSELLITWVTALCATHTPRDVSFLLADFKGGTAFDSLAHLPHVAGVITDLDGSGARRALQSLSAEVRRREAELTRVGARDVRDERAQLPRLVIVVDEFAALVSDHPELQPVFTDVAARGRALGMHLVLGTQRVAGVVRDALLANCALRVSLRVSDPSDSRLVIGTDDAARLPGGAASRGMALLRRAGDAAPRVVRIALTAPADIARAVDRSSSALPPWRPWLPELPRRVTVDQLTGESELPEGAVVVGLADEPHHQRQEPTLLRADERGLLVVGMASSGRTTALAAIAHQVPEGRLHWVPADPERAWDLVARLDQRAPAGSVVIVDDLDALLPRFPLDHAHVVAERLERLTRSAGDAGIRVVVSAQRLAGATARIAELLPRRAILAMPTRAEHVAAGGDGTLWSAGTAPGRATLDGRAVQLACGVAVPARTAEPVAEWSPHAGVTGLVLRRGAASPLADGLRARGAKIVPVDEAVAVVESRRPFDAPVVVVGDSDAWQRAWRVLAAVRAEHDLVIDATCAADYRTLSGDREPPPYCTPRPGRAWLLTPGETTRRVCLPVDDERPPADP